MLRAEDTQSFAVSTITRIVEIAKHAGPFNLCLEDGAERGLTFVFIKTALHVTDGIPDRQSDTASDALNRSGFRLAFTYFIRFVVRIFVDFKFLYFGNDIVKLL